MHVSYEERIILATKSKAIFQQSLVLLMQCICRMSTHLQ
jgi:hypothetical protein